MNWLMLLLLISIGNCGFCGCGYSRRAVAPMSPGNTVFAAFERLGYSEQCTPYIVAQQKTFYVKFKRQGQGIVGAILVADATGAFVQTYSVIIDREPFKILKFKDAVLSKCVERFGSSKVARNALPMDPLPVNVLNFIKKELEYFCQTTR